MLAGMIVFAQDPEFTQFYAAPIYTNPAMAGTATCGGRVNINYRNQWPSLPGTFVTYAASFDQHFDNLGGAIGLLFTHDVAGQGLLKTQTFSGVYSYYLQVNRKLSFRAGLQATYTQKSLDFSKLTFADQIDPIRGFVYQTNEPLPTQTKSFPNFATGFLAYTDNFYGGIAVHNLIEPNQSFYGNTKSNLPRRYTAHAGVVIPLDKKKIPENTISPNILFMLQQKFTQINAGFYANRGPLVTGLWYRQTLGQEFNSDALMVLIGFRKDKFKFGYSYDITVSSARAAAPGSHEISASIEWCAVKRTPKPRPLRCPDF